METKHTPGPWHVGQGQNAQIIYDKDGWGVANAVVYHRHHEPGSTIHNAKLIAAAPDLLAALQKLHTSLTELNDCGDAGRMVQDDVETARVAIALVLE